MINYWLKIGLSTTLIVIVSEIAKRSPKIGAFIGALPWVTIIVVILMAYENQPNEKIAAYGGFTFWYLLPTLPMFIVFPKLINSGIGFFISLLISSGVALIFFGILALVLKRFGIDLIF